jgi:hypothetical protein
MNETAKTEAYGYEILYRGQWVMDAGPRAADAYRLALQLSAHYAHPGLVTLVRMWATTRPGERAVWIQRPVALFVAGRQQTGDRSWQSFRTPAPAPAPLSARCFWAEVRCS